MSSDPASRVPEGSKSKLPGRQITHIVMMSCTTRNSKGIRSLSVRVTSRYNTLPQDRKGHKGLADNDGPWRGNCSQLAKRPG